MAGRPNSFSIGNTCVRVVNFPPHRARHPIERSQFIQHGAFYPKLGIGFKLYILGGIEFIHRINKADNPELIRSSIDIYVGRRMAKREAMYLIKGVYVRINFFPFFPDPTWRAVCCRSRSG